MRVPWNETVSFFWIWRPIFWKNKGQYSSFFVLKECCISVDLQKHPAEWIRYCEFFKLPTNALECVLARSPQGVATTTGDVNAPPAMATLSRNNRKAKQIKSVSLSEWQNCTNVSIACRRRMRPCHNEFVSTLLWVILTPMNSHPRERFSL